MQRWHGLEAVAGGWGPSTVAIGVFDGVHRGHQLLIGRAVAASREAGLPAAVVTFDPHPLSVLRPAAAPLLLAPLSQRLDLIERLGADATLVLPFTRELAGWSPQEFVQRVLVDALRAKHVVVGGDFRFGARAAGDVALLGELGGRFGFSVDEVELLRDPAGRISSTAVRAQLAAGDVEGAARALGRPHRLEAVVVPGDRRGRELGYPTANLDLPAQLAVPADGVYAGWLLHPLGDGGPRLPAAISIGTNPTFAGTSQRVEAHALDRDDLELYGERVAVEFVARLRDTWRFERVEDLVAQMRRDVDTARELTAG